MMQATYDCQQLAGFLQRKGVLKLVMEKVIWSCT